jgi:hypothetical protein
MSSKSFLLEELGFARDTGGRDEETLDASILPY